MKSTIPLADGHTVEFESGDAAAAEADAAILRGRTYPDLSFLGEVRTVVDIGAGSGAATVCFARRHPHATIHAVEVDTAQASLLRANTATLDGVELHDTLPSPDWTEAHNLDHIDVVKVSTPDADEVLGSLAHVLSTVKVVHVGYDSRATARRLERRFADTHDLYIGIMYLDDGECIYLRRDLADLPEATEHLRTQLAAGLRRG